METIFAIINSVWVFALWVITTLIIIPKSIEMYLKWKKTGKIMELAVAISGILCAFFLMSGLFVVFMKIVIRWTDHV